MNDALLNLFNARYTTDEDILICFIDAFKVAPAMAVIIAFHLRDVRFNGRREAFRLILHWLADNAAEYFTRTAQFIPEYGRWDDLLIFSGYKIPIICDCVRQLVIDQLKQDNAALRNSTAVSLLAKYMPSENASSTQTHIFARYWIQVLYGPASSQRVYTNAKHYRRMLSSLRAAINIPERLMSRGRWQEIDYDHVSLRAKRVYFRAFIQHDSKRYFDWLVSRRRRYSMDGTLLTGTNAFLRMLHSDRMNDIITTLGASI